MTTLKKAATTTSHAWSIATVAGGVLTALWFAFGWVDDQNDDREVMKEIAPKVLIQEQTLQSIQRQEELEAQRLELLCSLPNSDIPKSYCKGFEIAQPDP